MWSTLGLPGVTSSGEFNDDVNPKDAAYAKGVLAKLRLLFEDAWKEYRPRESFDSASSPEIAPAARVIGSAPTIQEVEWTPDAAEGVHDANRRSAPERWAGIVRGSGTHTTRDFSAEGGE